MFVLCRCTLSAENPEYREEVFDYFRIFSEVNSV